VDILSFTLSLLLLYVDLISALLLTFRYIKMTTMVNVSLNPCSITGSSLGSNMISMICSRDPFERSFRIRDSNLLMEFDRCVKLQIDVSTKLTFRCSWFL
jgi:hypothetical protein